MLRHRVFLFVKLAVAAGLVAWLFASGRINLSDLATVGERWPWFLAAQAPFGLVMLLAAIRWRLLLRAQGIHYTLHETFSLTMIGQLFNQFVIGSTGGDLVKAYMVAVEQPERRSAAVLSVFLDRFVGLLVLFTVVLAAVLWNLEFVLATPALTGMAGTVAVLLGVILAGGVLFYSSRFRSLPWVRWLFAKLPFRSFLGRLTEAVYVYRYHPRAVGLALLASLCVHLSVIAMNLLLARALIADPLPWRNFFLLIPLAQMAMALPINPPGAIGTAEGIYEYLLHLAGISQGAMVSLLQRFTYYNYALLGAIYYLRRKKKVARAVEAALEADARSSLGPAVPIEAAAKDAGP